MHSDPNYRKINFKNSSIQHPCAHPEIKSWLCPDKMTQKRQYTVFIWSKTGV